MMGTKEDQRICDAFGSPVYGWAVGLVLVGLGGLLGSLMWAVGVPEMLNLVWVLLVCFGLTMLLVSMSFWVYPGGPSDLDVLAAAAIAYSEMGDECPCKTVERRWTSKSDPDLPDAWKGHAESCDIRWHEIDGKCNCDLSKIEGRDV